MKVNWGALVWLVAIVALILSVVAGLVMQANCRYEIVAGGGSYYTDGYAASDGCVEFVPFNLLTNKWRLCGTYTVIDRRAE